MHERLAADERDAHGAEIANLLYPVLEIVEPRMRPRVVVFRAIGTIEIATVGDVETALEWFAIDEPLTDSRRL